MKSMRGMIATYLCLLTIPVMAQETKPQTLPDEPKPAAAAPAASASQAAKESDDAEDAASRPYFPPSVTDMIRLGIKYDKLNAWAYDAIWFPSVGDTVTREVGGIRPWLLKYNIGFRGMEIAGFEYNFSYPPMFGAEGVQSDGKYHSTPRADNVPQSWSGQRPTFNLNTFLYVTKNFGENTQLEVGTEYIWENFNQGAQIDSIRFNAIMLNQYFFKKRLKIMAGYTDNAAQYWGMYTAGNMAGTLQGVLSIIPFEVGEANVFKIAPALTARVNITKYIYSSSQIQRSQNPVYSTTIDHSPLNLRFSVKGAKAFLTEELGYKRESWKSGGHSLWARIDGFYNFSHYENMASIDTSDFYALMGKVFSGQQYYTKTNNNWAWLAAADYQVTRPKGGLAARGLYVGTMLTAAPSDQNMYTGFYGGSVYYQGLSVKRPLDTLAMHVNYTSFSRPAIKLAEFWNFVSNQPNAYNPSYVPTSYAMTSSTGQTNAAASYTVHVSQGIWWNAGIDYVVHPTITPKTQNAWVGTTGACLFW